MQFLDLILFHKFLRPILMAAVFLFLLLGILASVLWHGMFAAGIGYGGILTAIFIALWFRAPPGDGLDSVSTNPTAGT